MSKLDEYQMKVVNETGHCLVIAGPGSGKSTTICEKVKTLIANGTNESEILLISFTNKSVDDLKKKLGSNIFITTFHRLAIDILKYKRNCSELEKNVQLILSNVTEPTRMEK